MTHLYWLLSLEKKIEKYEIALDDPEILEKEFKKLIDNIKDDIRMGLSANGFLKPVEEGAKLFEKMRNRDNICPFLMI